MWPGQSERVDGKGRCGLCGWGGTAGFGEVVVGWFVPGCREQSQQGSVEGWTWGQHSASCGQKYQGVG